MFLFNSFFFSIVKIGFKTWWYFFLPYIFIFCADILDIQIRNNNNFRGIQIDYEESETPQFADDTSRRLDGSEKKSLKTFLDLLHKSSLIFGLFVNFDKTKVIRIGSPNTVLDQ